MEYYSAIKNNEFMKFLGKWLELENIMLSEVNQTQNNIHGMQLWLAQKLWIPKTQLTYQIIPKKKKGESPGPEKAWRSI